VVLDAQQVAAMSKRMLIVSDGRAGHENQSVALAKYLNIEYDVVQVMPRFGWSKAFALLSDRTGMYIPGIFRVEKLPQADYDYVVGCGSTTYYTVKRLAKALQAKSVAMMLPKGYRYDFDIILAQLHDDPPKRENIKTLPVNVAYVEPKGLFRKKGDKPAIGIVIGGENSTFRMSRGRMEAYLDEIVSRFGATHTLVVSTSPRTSAEVEALVASYDFDYSVIYAKEPVNPIPDFLAQCEMVFVTADSTSMLSEAVSFGSSAVVVLPLESEKEGKHQRFVEMLEKEEYVHIYDGSIKYRTRKVDLSHALQKVFA
jgi:mitochondrial fission protein ELM1